MCDSSIEFEEDYNPYLEKDKAIFFSRNKLPHWDQPGKTQFITFRLCDSLPQSVIHNLNQFKENFLKLNPEPWSQSLELHFRKIISWKIQSYMDAGYGECHLRRIEIRNIIKESLEKYNYDKYYLDAYVLMPNHVHILITTEINVDYRKIISNIKRYTSRRINMMLGRSGELWTENFDRIIRDEDHYRSCLAYIKNNPKLLNDSEYTLGGNHPRMK